MRTDEDIARETKEIVESYHRLRQRLNWWAEGGTEHVLRTERALNTLILAFERVTDQLNRIQAITYE